MRTMVTLENDVLDAAESHGQASGKSIGRARLQGRRRGPDTSAHGPHTNGLPTFKVASDSDLIPSSRARGLLAEEAP